MEKTIKPCVGYGMSHSKFYKPSILSNLLAEVDDDGNLVHFNNDIYLLTRKEKLMQKIGVDSVRAYISNMLRAGETTERANLTEEQLFSLIDPKEVNNLTTQYEYMKYLKNNHSKFKKDYENAVRSAKQYSDFKNKYLIKTS